MYELFFKSGVPVNSLTPALSLDQCLADANAGNRSYQTNLVRLNWMITDIQFNGIQKPFLVDKDLKIITGDTRYMALHFCPLIKYVPVLMTAKDAPVGWVNIDNKKELSKLLDIDPENIITNNDWTECELDWIEFAYPHTSDHMHDEVQRERMIKHYLLEHPETVFDYNWLLETIDWSLYDH